jgi:hypothetical protein
MVPKERECIKGDLRNEAESWSKRPRLAADATSETYQRCRSQVYLKTRSLHVPNSRSLKTDET